MREPPDTLRRTVAIVLALASALGSQQPAANAAGRSLTIRGRVIDSNGEPLPKAGVAVSTDPDFSTATALGKPRVRCGADGSFELVLERTNRGAPTELLIAAPGKVAFLLPSLETLLFASESRHPSRIDFGVLCLPDGFTMTGRVRGPDGKPLAGARIRATDCLSFYPWMQAGFGSRATTNASGVFVLGGVFAQAMAITVDADGCYEKRLPCVDLAQPLDVQLEASGFVEGTLLDEAGKPADGFVSAAYEFLGAPSGDAVRAVAGVWKLPVTQPCRFFVNATRDGQAFQWWSGPAATSNLLPGPTQGVELRLGGDAAHGFRISAADGKGARVAPIRAACLPDSIAEQVEGRLHYYVTPSAADGAVLLRSPWGGRGGTHDIVVVADGFAPFLDKNVVWQDGGSYEAKLVPECRIVGHVLDAATGQPVAGALVTCERVRPKADAMRGVPVVTAADGSFTWRGLAAEPCMVTVRHADGTATVSQRVKWKAAGEQQEVSLSLPAGVTVSGKLTGPLQPRWRVQLAPPRSTDSDTWFNATGIDELFVAGTAPLIDGAFRFEHRGEAHDELLLVVPLPPRQGNALRVPLDKVRTRKDAEVVELDVSKLLPGAFTGKVALRGADFPFGRLAVVAVEAARNDRGRGGQDEVMRRRSWQLLGTDGAFRIPVVAGKYALRAVDVATGVVLFRTGEIEVAAGASLQHDLAIDVVEVRVGCEAAGRKQLGAERVEVQDQGQWEMTMFGGRHGSPGAEIDQQTRSARLFLPPGTFRLRAGVGASPMAGTFSWGNEPAAEVAIDVTLGKVNEVTLELPDPADPTGR